MMFVDWAIIREGLGHDGYTTRAQIQGWLTSLGTMVGF